MIGLIDERDGSLRGRCAPGTFVARGTARMSCYAQRQARSPMAVPRDRLRSSVPGPSRTSPSPADAPVKMGRIAVAGLPAQDVLGHLAHPEGPRSPELDDRNNRLVQPRRRRAGTSGSAPPPVRWPRRGVDEPPGTTAEAAERRAVGSRWWRALARMVVVPGRARSRHEVIACVVSPSTK